MLLPSQPDIFPRRPVIPEEWIAGPREDADARALYVAGAGDAHRLPAPPPGTALLPGEGALR